MGVEQRMIIDAAGIDKATGELVLTIADSLDWSNVRHHLGLLKDKIGDYGNFLDAEDYLESYPDADGRKKRIHVMFRFAPLDPDVTKFLADIDHALADMGYSFSHAVFEGSA